MPIDPRRFLTTILANGECGCRGEDGDQSRLNVSANLERPVQNRPFGFLTTKRHQKAQEAQKEKEKEGSKKGAFYYKLDKRRYDSQFHSFMNFIPNPDNLK